MVVPVEGRESEGEVKGRRLNVKLDEVERPLLSLMGGVSKEELEGMMGTRRWGLMGRVGELWLLLEGLVRRGEEEEELKLALDVSAGREGRRSLSLSLLL